MANAESRGGAQAVLQGRWVLIEDLDLAPLEVLASLIPLLDSRRLFIPARDAVAVARPGFRFLATRATARVRPPHPEILTPKT